MENKYYVSDDGEATAVLPSGEYEGFIEVAKAVYDTALAQVHSQNPFLVQRETDIAALVAAGMPEAVVRRLFGLGE